MDNSLCSCSILNPTDCSAPPKTFTFDGVYHVNSTTEQIYNEIAYPLVEVSNGKGMTQEGRKKNLGGSDMGSCNSQ